jgi:hypothetical protein
MVMILLPRLDILQQVEADAAENVVNVCLFGCVPLKKASVQRTAFNTGVEYCCTMRRY